MVIRYLPPQLEETADSSNITLVVSHPWLQEAFMRLLQDAGIIVSVMTTPEELLDGIDEAVDIVMVDVMAYQSQYRHLFEMVRQKHPGVIIIALLSEHTAYHSGDVVWAGANGIVIKENADTELLPTLYSLLSGRRITKISSRLLDAVKRCEALKQEEVSELVEKKKLEEQSNLFHLSRRSFLKASAATVAAAGTIAADPWGTAMKALAETTGETAGAGNEEKIFSGACRGNCAGGCFLNVHVRDDKVVRTSMRELPNPEYNRICVKGLTHVQRIYHQERLKYPMKRAGDRGEGKWERITWDEAIKTITDKWKEYTAQYGKQAFSIFWGSGSYGTLSGLGMGCTTSRLLNVTGASNISMAVDAANGKAAGAALGWGPNFTSNEMADLKNAKSIFIWGANPVISQVHNSHFFIEAREKGAKLVVIDPVYNTMASKADIFVPLRPCSDGALALGMMNIIVREKWMDVPFLKKSTVAPFLVKESDGKYLRLSDMGRATAGSPEDAILVRDAEGNVGLPAEIADPVIEGSFELNGIKVKTAYSLLLERIAEYPPEKVSELCGIPVEQIEEITKIYAVDKPATTYTFFGMDHYYNGHWSYFAFYALGMLTGNMCKPGSSCGMGENLGINFPNLAGALFPAGATGPSMKLVSVEMGRVMSEQKYGNKPAVIKGVYITHANPVNNMAERKYTLEWLNKMDFIAVADMNMNETALYADILLPVAHWFEVDDIFVNYSTHPYVLMQEKAIEPLYECKSDFEIQNMIAEKLGYGSYFNMTETEYMKMWLDSDAARGLGITVENLREKKAIKNLPGDNYIANEGGVFGTPTGRAQFYNESPAPDNDYDQQWDIGKERLPYWEKPYEAWYDLPVRSKYPFTIISDHSRFRTHSQWWDVPVLLEIDREPTVKINSIDAAKHGIKTGDKVKIFNDRGYVVMKADINDGVQPGVLTAPKGWEKQQFIDGHFSDLTSHFVNPTCANSAFNDVAVAVEKL